MKNQPIGGNELARFSGPNTFMRLPSANDLKGLDVVFLGVPVDIGTSWRSGTRFGPKQIRSESAMIRPYHIQTGSGAFRGAAMRRYRGSGDQHVFAGRYAQCDLSKL